MIKVIIYTTPTCVYCKLAKEFFQKNKIEYEEKNVVTDTEARGEMIKKSGQLGVPVIEIGEQIIVGFDQSAIRSALGI